MFEIKPFILWGHQVFPLGFWTNVMLAISVFSSINYFVNAYAKKQKVWSIITGWYCFCMFPNAAYLFLEIKHLFVDDGVAEPPCLEATLFFTGFSLFGFILTIYSVLYAANRLPYPKKYRTWAIVILSFMSSFGGVLGLLDIASLMGFVIPPLIVIFAVELFSSWQLVVLAIGVGTLFTVTSLSVDSLLARRRVPRTAFSQRGGGVTNYTRY